MRRVAVSTPPAEAFAAPDLTQLFAAAGYALTPYPADGAGGRALEAAVRAGEYAGVLDLALHELAAELLGGVHAAGPDRLTAAAVVGIPQVIAPGGCDAVAFAASPGPGLASVRTSPEECDRLGLDIAQKACAARGPTAILLPAGDGSAAAAALRQSIRNWVAGVELVELELRADDPAFRLAAGRKLLELLGRSVAAEVLSAPKPAPDGDAPCPTPPRPA